MEQKVLEFATNIDNLIVALIVIAILTVIKVLLGEKWNNGVVQRLLWISPFIVGGLVAMAYPFKNLTGVVVTGYMAKFWVGVIDGMLSMVVFNVFKGLTGGKDVADMLKLFWSKAPVAVPPPAPEPKAPDVPKDTPTP